MKSSLPVILRKATPAAIFLGVTLILTGCNADQSQEELLPEVHSTTYGQSAVALPQDLRQDLRHHHRNAPTFQTRHHAAPPADTLIAGN